MLLRPVFTDNVTIPLYLSNRIRIRTPETVRNFDWKSYLILASQWDTIGSEVPVLAFLQPPKTV